MDLQNTFYLFGIVFMSLFIILMVALVVVIFYIMKKVHDIHDLIDRKIDYLLKHKGDIAADMGKNMVSSAVAGVTNLLKSKRHHTNK